MATSSSFRELPPQAFAPAPPSWSSSKPSTNYTGKIRSTLTQPDLTALLVKGEADGQGIWGRWNANGPGTAKLVADLKLGTNFEDIHQAQPGDFMKIFWSNTTS